MQHCTNIVLKLGQRVRQWANIKSTMGQCPVLAGRLVFYIPSFHFVIAHQLGLHLVHATLNTW